MRYRGLESFNNNYHLISVRRESYNEFRRLCHLHSLAATHQRQKIYEALVSRPGHYSPEEIYDQVKGVTEEQILTAVRIASVVHALAVVFDTEAVLAQQPSVV